MPELTKTCKNCEFYQPDEDNCHDGWGYCIEFSLEQSENFLCSGWVEEGSVFRAFEQADALAGE